MSSSAEPAKRNGILSSLALTLPYVRPWLPRMFVGALSALGATIVALVIPMVMRVLVDGPLAEKETLSRCCRSACSSWARHR